MSDDNNNKKTYKEAASDFYNRQYESWVPWAEDQYLKYFTKDNKASYATKQQLDQTKVTGNSQVDTLQDGVNDLVAGQVGQGGLAQPVGDYMSKEGVNRSERGGKDAGGKGIEESGPLGGVAGGVKGVGDGVAGGVKGAGDAVGSLLGGGGGKK